MTKEEWLQRSATAFEARAGVVPEVAMTMAQDCYDAQDGESSESANYTPEECADAEIDELAARSYL